MLRIFVGCPFGEPPITGYRQAFEDVLDQVNEDRDEDDEVEFVFIDEWIGHRDLLQHLLDVISEVDSAVFDLTGFNSNVLIELGIALAAENSETAPMWDILIIERLGYNNREDVPADIQGLTIHSYSSRAALRSLLESYVARVLERLDEA